MGGLKQRRLILEVIVLGVAGAFTAQLFDLAVRGVTRLLLGWMARYTPPGLPEEGGVLHAHFGAFGLWLVPLSTTLGGLLAGWLVYTWAPEAEGHGTDAAVKAFHLEGGRMRARVPFVKLIASAITIGSGGSAGREGPTALITGGLGSIYGGLFKRSDLERRILMLAGVAAGLSAIFRSPIGAALFAVEVLYQTIEFEAAALFYTMLASVVAYAVNGLSLGWNPLFRIPPLGAPHFTDYGWYALLGIASGVVATGVPVAFYGARDFFARIRLPALLKPALGGLLLGLIAIKLPQLLGGGYGWVQEAIDGRMTAGLLVVLLFGKIVALCLTVSSGGSGGVFAPTLFIGAMVGALMGQLLGLPPAQFAIVGMAAVFAGAARVPMATLLMVVEMTSGFQLLVPAGLAVMVSYVVQEVLSDRLRYRSLYEAQVVGRADSPAHHADQLSGALKLIERGALQSGDHFGHVDLVKLISAGVPVNLVADELFIGRVLADGPLCGLRVDNAVPPELADAVEIAALLRGGQVHLAHRSSVLSTGDQVVVLVAPAGRSWFLANFAPHSAVAPKAPPARKPKSLP